MKALLQYMPIQNGHFRWCSQQCEPLVACGQGCDRCKAEVYTYAIILSAIVVYLEFWGSGQTGSLSLATDAWHMGYDTLGYCIGLVGAVSMILFHHSEKRVEKSRRRLEMLMAAFLITTALTIFYETGQRIWQGNIPEIIESQLLLRIAAIGLLVNVVFLALFWALKIGHTHGSEHSHTSSPHTHGNKDKILSANFWHTFSDTVSSMMVVGNGITYQVTSDSSWFFLEFVVSLIIAGLLFWQGWRIFFLESDAVH